MPGGFDPPTPRDPPCPYCSHDHHWLPCEWCACDAHDRPGDE